MRVTNLAKLAVTAGLACAMSACVAGPRVSPVEITRFHQSGAVSQLGSGTIFVENAPGDEVDAAELSVFKAAIASELAELGYREVPRSEASQIAQVRVQRYVSQPERSRSPVSVGAGGSTGTYGSGLGLGIGINLGGGQREMIGTDLGVMIRDKASNDVIWEGRASISVSDNSDYADSSANASVIADALFSEFPGNNGETVEVRVSN
ncbi:DUF4136 domain-containing protein [Pontixanthobacter aquaemixtae]|uniref:DUF4136 domain-containing protein n=1 Tax=Pontixanthobacter aquaemixtae TaxID=1958940 RepID=A0A844ZY91_9SPHN|nr:DUF4136 domain-containing protein [Pontixanthobacter aquaemixtae]MXO91717.1 DUF4136 domain-containing protein [Pontixanthobacter aquaemixtae]